MGARLRTVSLSYVSIRYLYFDFMSFYQLGAFKPLLIFPPLDCELAGHCGICQAPTTLRPLECFSPLLNSPEDTAHSREVQSAVMCHDEA